MKSILLVDDEKNFLLSLADMLQANEDEFSIKTAGNGKDAAEIIDNEDVDLVVTDLNMPVMDGFELMAHISQVNSELPVIAMTAYGTPEMESRLRNMGAFQYIEKPIDFDSLLRKIKNGLKTGSTKGHVAGISLPSFMQLLELDKKTCTLHIKSGNNRGDMFFKQGELYSARTGKITGQEAAFEIINWENSEIEIENVFKIKEADRDINVPMGFLLIESARMKDEKNRPAREEEEEEDQRQEGSEKSQPGTAELPGVDVDNIGFATTSAPAAETLDTRSLEPEVAPAPPVTEERSPLDTLTDTILNAKGVNRMIIISGNGTVLAHNNIPVKEFGAFTAAVTGSAVKIKKILGFTGPKHIIINHSNGEKILILIGSQIVVGIGLTPDTDPEPISEVLKPTVTVTRAG
jgi:DNA-binding response OmpR family regulator/predicted regulator of Ras-like GTPase activity (Roadblock/LC7/MglB family)